MPFTSVIFGYVAAALVACVIIGGLGEAFVRRMVTTFNRQRFQLDAALNHMSHGLCMFDAAGVLRLMNARYLEVFNIPEGLIQPGLSLRDLLRRLEDAGIVTGDQEKYAASVIADMAAGKKTQSLKLLKDGRTVCITNRPLPGGGWVATHEDITERVRAEQRAREANDYLRGVIEALPAGLIIYDSEDRYVLCNKRFEAMYPRTADMRVPGMSFEAILRAGLARGVYDEALGREEAWIAERLAAHRLPDSVYEQKHANGRWLRIEDSHTPNGGHIGIRIDVTELKQREEQLRLENLKLDAALQNMSQGLVMFDRDGKLIVCNQKYAELYRLPPELSRPGVSHKQILEHRIGSGVVAETNSVRYVKDRTEVGVPKSPTETILELADGRTLLVALRPLQNGGWVSTHEDITSRREAEAQIAHMAHHDALTNLPNRTLLRERLEDALAHVQRGGQIAVLYLDLDHFKSINDTLGHGVGDELLKAVALRLKSCIGEDDTIARLGGDEFAIVQTAIGSPSDVANLAARIRDALTEPYEFEGH
jgi:diguanylate cyclase (GGDEF)-like protein